MAITNPNQLSAIAGPGTTRTTDSVSPAAGSTLVLAGFGSRASADVAWNAPGGTLSATWTAATEGIDDATADSIGIKIWYAEDGDWSGSGTVSVSTTAGSSSALVLMEVDSDDPLEFVNAANAGATGATVDAAYTGSADVALYFSAVAMGSSTSWTPLSGATEEFEGTDGEGILDLSYGWDNDATNGAINPIGATASNAEEMQVCSVIAFNEGSAAVAITAVEATATASGAIPTVSSPKAITAAEGTATAAGAVPTVAVPTEITAVEGAATAAGTVPTVASPVAITSPEGAATAAGAVPTVTVSSGTPVAITVPEATAAAAGAVPTVVVPTAVTAPEATATAAGAVPTVAVPVAVTVPEGAATAAGAVPTVAAPVGVTAVEGAATAAGSVPTVVVTADSAVVEVNEGVATAGGSPMANIGVPPTRITQKLPTGMHPPARVNEPSLGATLDYINEAHSKLGAGVRLKRTSDQAITTASSTAISWEASELDSHGFWTSTAPTLVTIPEGLDGVFVLSANLRFAADATGSRAMKFVFSSVSGETNPDSEIRVPPMSVWVGLNICLARAVLRSGDTVAVNVWQDSGGNLNVEPDGNDTCLSLTRVGDIPRTVGNT